MQSFLAFANAHPVLAALIVVLVLGCVMLFLTLPNEHIEQMEREELIDKIISDVKNNQEQEHPNGR